MWTTVIRCINLYTIIPETHHVGPTPVDIIDQIQGIGSNVIDVTIRVGLELLLIIVRVLDALYAVHDQFLGVVSDNYQLVPQFGVTVIIAPSAVHKPRKACISVV